MELLNATPLGGDGFQWQIDESYFAGRRKWQRGKYKTGVYKEKEILWIN